MRTRLAQRGFPSRDIDGAIGVAKDAGMIDDEAFAQLWVEDRVLHHPLARYAVERELLDKGVARATVQSALADRYSEHLERDLLLRLARERFERLERLDPKVRARRTIGFLARRGFSPGLAGRIVRTLEQAAKEAAKETAKLAAADADAAQEASQCAAEAEGIRREATDD